MPDPDRALIRAAFDDVLDHPKPDRSAYLASAYGRFPKIVEAVQDLLNCYCEEAQTACATPATDTLARVFLPGQMIAGRFRLVKFLGAGGMGQVYEVHDEKLSVSVALKTLHPVSGGDPAVWERFRREIRVAREFAHQNLCRVYDLVEHQQNGKVILCLTMELLNGENLAGYIARMRPVPPCEALGLLRPIAEVLDLMHARGIVHRDLKPSNVMLTPGYGASRRIVVMDFGLAKPMEGGATLFESRTETRAGSPYFMAPELWEGAPPSIASDVYAFGLIADELVTQSTAFQTGSLAGFYYSKFREGPVPPRQRENQLPECWEKAILRCLDPDPRRRPRSPTAFLQELEHSATSTLPVASLVSRRTSSGPSSSPHPRTSIAVMPFSDLSPAQDQVYFCNGLTEELIHLLSQTASLRVISRESVFEARRRGASSREIARELNVTHLLTGSVRKEDRRLRITVQLADAVEGCNLWSERFDREMTDAIVIQEEIAAASLELLKNQLPLASDRPPLHLAHTTSMQAYNSYLQGLFEFNQQTGSAIQKAEVAFERAASADPLFAPAYCGMADCCCALEWYGLRAPGETMPLAKHYAERALSLTRTLASPFCTLAIVKARYEWDWNGAANDFRRALALNPGLSKAYFSYALDYLTPTGQLDEALRSIRYALHLDPLSPLLHTAVGGCLYRARQYDAALETLRRTLEMNPNFYHAHWSAARVLEQLGRYDEAVEEYQTAVRGSPDNPLILSELGHCHGARGNKILAEGVLRQLENQKPGQYRSPLCEAFVHLGLAENIQALRHLETALVQRPGALTWISVDPRFDPLRGEAEFQHLLSTMGLNG